MILLLNIVSFLETCEHNKSLKAWLSHKQNKQQYRIPEASSGFPRKIQKSKLSKTMFQGKWVSNSFYFSTKKKKKAILPFFLQRIKRNTVFNLITTYTPINAQSNSLVVFRLEPMYFHLFYKSICCWHSFELPQIIEAVQTIVTVFRENRYIPMWFFSFFIAWLYKLGQGHQNLISSLLRPNYITKI